jgi:RNA polymerase sigma factor (sigma-70 family)
MPESEPSSPCHRKARAEELYGQMKPLLLFIAASKFHVSLDEAEALVHDVFESYLRRRPVIANEQGWFVGAICNACRHYWRKYGRYVALEEAADDDMTCETPIIERLTAEALVARLSPRDRRVISLRFDDGRTIREVGRVLGISRSRAEKLLRRALRRLAEAEGAELSEDSDETHRWVACLHAIRKDAHGRHKGCQRFRARRAKIRRRNTVRVPMFMPPGAPDVSEGGSRAPIHPLYTHIQHGTSSTSPRYGFGSV